MLARRPVTSDNTVVKGAIRQLLRSSGAVVAGLAVTVLLSVATDMAMPVLDVFGPDGMPRNNGSFIVATLYRLVYSIDGCRIAARLTPAHPMRHAIVLSLRSGARDHRTDCRSRARTSLVSPGIAGHYAALRLARRSARAEEKPLRYLAKLSATLLRPAKSSTAC